MPVSAQLHKRSGSDTGCTTCAFATPPLKILMPLDKAGYKVDVIFEVPTLAKGKTFLGSVIGLRVLFAPGTSEVNEALREHPVTIRIFLTRIEEDGEEVKIPLFDSVRISARGESPRRYDVFEIPERKATASLLLRPTYRRTAWYARCLNRGADFAAANRAVTPGVYRFQLETLEDIPELMCVRSSRSSRLFQIVSATAPMKAHPRRKLKLNYVGRHRLRDSKKTRKKHLSFTLKTHV